MEVLFVSKNIKISSHKGVYEVNFTQDWSQTLEEYNTESTFFIIDSAVADLYKIQLETVFNNKYYLIEANEKNKSLENQDHYQS